MTPPDLGRAAYEAFCEHIRERNDDAEPIYGWHSLNVADQQAWRAVAQAVSKAAGIDVLGTSVDVKGPMGDRALRFIRQHQGTWLTINQAWGSGPPFNGFLIPDWRGVLRELIAQAQPAALMNERGRIAEAVTGGQYHNVPLSYPLSAKALAGLLGADEAAVRAELADLVVEQYR